MAFLEPHQPVDLQATPGFRKLRPSVDYETGKDGPASLCSCVMGEHRPIHAQNVRASVSFPGLSSRWPCILAGRRGCSAGQYPFPARRLPRQLRPLIDGRSGGLAGFMDALQKVGWEIFGVPFQQPLHNLTTVS